MGKSNWQLVDSGRLNWEDVVSRSRIKSFREVVATYNLSQRELKAAGVAPWRAERTYEAIHTPERQAALAARRGSLLRLQQLGVTPEESIRYAAERLAGRVGFEGPSGPQFIPQPGPVPRPIPAQTFETHAAAKAFSDRHATRQELTGAQARVAAGYKGFDYKRINESLRGKRERTPELAQKIRILDQATKAASGLEDAVVVWRGVKNYGVLGIGDPGAAIGTILRDPAFLSVSLRREQAKRWGQLVEIRIPEGTPALAMEGLPGPPPTIEEDELLLGRGLMLQVTGVAPDGHLQAILLPMLRKGR